MFIYECIGQEKCQKHPRFPSRGVQDWCLISRCIKMEVSKNEHIINTCEKIYGDECRICLKRAVEICELFRNGDAITRKLMAVASVQVEEGDGLPPVICVSCNQRLDASYDFKCQIQSSDEKLRQILKLKSSSDSSTSTSIVTAIIADVISNVISSEKEISEIKPEICSTNFCPDNFCFTKDDSFCLSAEKNLFCYDKESQSQLNDKEQRKSIENVNIYKSLLEDDSIREINSVKQQELSLLDAHQARNKDIALKAENNDEILEKRQMLEESLKIEGIQDDEEKPLIVRATRLRCTQCIKSFRTKVALQRHAIVHKRKTKLRYVCYVCDKQYSTLAKAKSHVAVCCEANDKKENIQERRISYEQEEETSDVQDKRFDDIQNKRKIPKNDNSSKEQRKNLKFTCKVCSKQFTYQKSFITHAKSHPEYKLEELDDSSRCSTKERSTENVEEQEEANEEEDEEEDEEDENLPAENLQCTQCGKLFATKKNLKRHISTHSGLKYTCETCGKGFSRIDKLKDHEQSKHKPEIFDNSDFSDKEDTDDINRGDCFEGRKKDRHNRPHKCTICPKSFAQAQSLANHVERHKRVKETQKRFLCEVCSKCFAQSGSLVAHMRTHTGVKPYVCNVCSRAFTKSTYLQLHLRTHSGEKPYICQYCSRAFARANTLARHITMHTGEAKYHCQICTKSFRRLTSLNEHTYTHTGQRPYACKICTKRYNNAGSLYAHRKKCKAQQLSNTGFAVSTENSIPHQDINVPQVLIYSQKKLVEDATVGQVTPTPQYMIPNVHNQKSLGSNLIQPFAMEDPNVYAINSKQFKNPYYTIYPNM